MYTSTIQSMKKEMNRRRLSQRTIDSYLFCIYKFLKKINKHPRKITKKEIKNYMDDLSERGKAGSTLNIHLSAIKFLIEETFHRNLFINLKYSRRPKHLPTVLTKEETKRLFDAVHNPKHKLMIELMYSAGLRLSELLNLKVKDIEDKLGWVRKGKGNKDRPFIIADKLRQRIIDFIDSEKLNHSDLIFTGRNGRVHPRTVQEIIKQAAKKARIRKNVHPHTLRHSFATHLIEDGYDVADVQALLGHNSMQTTMIYVHLAGAKLLSVKSPFDNL